MKKQKKEFMNPALTDMIQVIEQSDDFRTFETKVCDQSATILYLETLVDRSALFHHILDVFNQSPKSIEELLETLAPDLLATPSELTNALLKGRFGIFLKDLEKIYAINLPNSADQSRPVGEPDNEVIIRGAHDGFVENFDVNISILRRRIQSEDLRVKYVELGNVTKTKTAIIYLEGLANQDIVKEIERRLSYIDIDMVISPGYIEEFIEDSAFSIFPQMLNTERPDRTMAAVNEGKIALMAEASPTCLILPSTFVSFFQSPDDYNSRWVPATFIRFIRFFSVIIALTLPSIYIAVIGFHFEITPHELVLPLKASVEGIPFPPLMEAFIMEVTFELVREAGVRLPKAIGQTIGIVGGLVIGDAVVSAGLISNIMIVVVAITAISSFVVPNNEMRSTIRLLRFPLMVISSLFGLVGLVFGLIFILISLVKLESFGEPYFAPFAPFRVTELKDTVIRVPLWMMNKRPKNGRPLRLRRQGTVRGWKKTNEFK
ncbi:spore germination protein [Bacillus salacetis]|uniref:Spore germination protein n=1 Tax=Bacillus salacetis TaxID=2315464 RepID=A0A3A1QZE5_9BACI|nr:spore germination protein [Bacillus salacetis]RIW34669.1 spore germination protein [Bacillus salacetis]